MQKITYTFDIHISKKQTTLTIFKKKLTQLSEKINKLYK